MEQKKQTTDNETNLTQLESDEAASGQGKTIMGALAALILIAILGGLFWFARGSAEKRAGKEPAEETHAESEGGGNSVELSAEVLAAAKLETEEVAGRSLAGRLSVTGAIELDPQGTQIVTPLVGGRVERVLVELGAKVERGAILAYLSSPAIAQLHGKLHEAQARLGSAERNAVRVQQAENRAVVLSAKARLDEAEANLRRVRRLIELGAGAGKDLIAAETAYKTAQAEYDFQSNIALNREAQEAQAELATAKAEVGHILDELNALGAEVDEANHQDNAKHQRENKSLIPLRAPLAGIVIERNINVGAGIEAGTALFTVSNLQTVYVVANVPEVWIKHLRVGATAEIRSAVLGENSISGIITFIEPTLDQSARAARTRIKIANPSGQLKAEMFAQVNFDTGAKNSAAVEPVISVAAAQRIGERVIVFVPMEEPGHFEAREVELGAESDGYRRVLAGLKIGERVVTKGSFTLKTQLLKRELGEHDH